MQEEAQNYAEQKGLIYIETSPKIPGNCMETLKNAIKKAALNHILLNRIEAFVQTQPDNEEIKGIDRILRSGLNSDIGPQKYFELEFEALKGHLDTLQMTSKSLFNSALNIIVTVCLALTVVGLPLAYCLGLLKKNEEASGHKLMFFAFGAKQAGQIACRDVFKQTHNEDLKFSRSY